MSANTATRVAVAQWQRGLDASALAGSRHEFICFLRIGDGLNLRMRLAEMHAGSPVLGLRPRRSLFWRTTNEPKELSFTQSSALPP